MVLSNTIVVLILSFNTIIDTGANPVFPSLTKWKNTMRKRFNRNRIASSDNYSRSRKCKRDFLIETHLKNIDLIKEITQSIKMPYIKVFGKEVCISREEASRLSPEINVIMK